MTWPGARSSACTASTAGRVPGTARSPAPPSPTRLRVGRPLRGDNPLADRLADLDNLTDTDRAALIHIFDGLLANTRIRAALSNAG